MFEIYKKIHHGHEETPWRWRLILRPHWVYARSFQCFHNAREAKKSVKELIKLAKRDYLPMIFAGQGRRWRWEFYNDGSRTLAESPNGYSTQKKAEKRAKRATDEMKVAKVKVVK